MNKELSREKEMLEITLLFSRLPKMKKKKQTSLPRIDNQAVRLYVYMFDSQSPDNYRVGEVEDPLKGITTGPQDTHKQQTHVSI